MAGPYPSTLRQHMAGVIGADEQWFGRI